MTIREKIDEIAFELDITVLLADGFDDAIVGIGAKFTQTPSVVYDKSKCVEILMERDGMDYGEALDWMEFNVYGAWVGDNTPIFMDVLQIPQFNDSWE